MRKIGILSTVLILGLAGCSQVVSGINSVTGALTSPAANKAAANLKTGTTALVCFVGGVSALTNNIASQVNAGAALIKDSTEVYVISSNICAALGGTVTGTSIVGVN